MIRNALLLGVACYVLSITDAAAAAVVNFSGTSGGRSVSGFLSYDPSTPSFDGFGDSDSNVAYYFPGTFSFKSGGLKLSDDFLAVIGDAFEGNSQGLTDSFFAYRPGREEYGFTVNYANATTLNSSSLPLALAEGSATFFYSRLGNGFSIPVTFTTAVPEPATWVAMVGGFGLIGAAMRRRRKFADRSLA
jgi:hypothetical protein